MKMFGGTFNKFENFRYELKRGATESVFAIVAFVVLAMIGFFVTCVIGIVFEVSHETLGLIAKTYLYLAGFTFMYNAIKAAFECFLVERERVFNRLRDE
jgi:hypothetical protein